MSRKHNRAARVFNSRLTAGRWFGNTEAHENQADGVLNGLHGYVKIPQGFYSQLDENSPVQQHPAVLVPGTGQTSSQLELSSAYTSESYSTLMAPLHFDVAVMPVDREMALRDYHRAMTVWHDGEEYVVGLRWYEREELLLPRYRLRVQKNVRGELSGWCRWYM
jgi:hypothetical protein